jgi:hypothetical protein
MVKSFNKCCISNVMDKTNDDIFWNGGEGDGNIRSESESEGDEGTDYEDRDSDSYW